VSNGQNRDDLTVIAIQGDIPALAELDHALSETRRHLRCGPADFRR